MKNKVFSRYYLLSCIGGLIASYYPLYMGVRVIVDMIIDGTVLKENYPKYIIPYTPISIAIIIGVLLMPLCIKLFRKYALAGGASVATGAFFALEFLFEQNVIVSTAETVTKLEDWQMYMCYTPPGGWGESVTTYKTQTAVDILMGNYHPAFKLHFYLISVVLIITILNCLYGFGQAVKTGKTKRVKALILQSVCSLTFLGLCILACFTAFWRDGSIQVSPLSATLMSVFFVLFGITVGVFIGSFLLGKSKPVSVFIPSITASVMTLLMYIGEMILLNGHLYQLGAGFMFDRIPGIVFAPIDLFMIIAAGGLTALLFLWLNGFTKKHLTVTLSVVSAMVLILLVVSGFGAKQPENKVPDLPEVDYSTVRVLEKISDAEFSSYQVGADLPATVFSSVGQTLTDKIASEWATYDSMTTVQQLVSSKLWGLVSIQAETWQECEEVIGFTVDNPLEGLSWLNKTEYFGGTSVDPFTPADHVLITANAAQNTDRTLREINVTAGYNRGDVRVTLSATLCADAQDFSTVGGSNGYATYDESTGTTGSGIPVLIVTTNETNNTGYYNANYYDPTAYWVKGNVFYTLRVFGDETDQADIQATLDRILDEI